MGKKFSFFKVFICLIAFGVFSWYEYHLILKYLQESKVRKEILDRNTENIEKSFLIREKEFYLNSNYIKGFEEMKVKEQQKDSSGGEEALEQLEQFEQFEEFEQFEQFEQNEEL